MTVDRLALLERYGREYGRLKLAIAFTASTEGDDAKRVVKSRWQDTSPFDRPEIAARILRGRGERRNPALVLRASGLLGIECDSEEDLAAVMALGLPETVTVQSSEPYRLHFWFRPHGPRLPYAAFKFEAGKVTADSGRYFLCPPALHPSGAVYKFLRSPEETEIATLPQETYEALVERASRDGSELRERLKSDPAAKVPEGQRRDLIFRFCCSQRAYGVPPEQILEGALALNRERCDPPVSEAEVRVQWEGACKYPAGTVLGSEQLVEQEIQAIVPGSGLPEGDGSEKSCSAVPAIEAEQLLSEQEQPPPVGTARVFVFATAREFAAVKEKSAVPLLGRKGRNVLPAGGIVITYGAEGAGKTTMNVDQVAHLATATPWLGLEVPRAVNVLVVENDGPRGPFREKIEAKLAAWDAADMPDPGDHLHFLEEPWGEVSFAKEEHRLELAAFIREHKIDLLVAGPIVSLGMIGGGTPDEVAAFEAHIRALRALLDDPLAAWLLHHENVRGEISGAWGRVTETLIHLTATGNGHTRLFWKKVRWGSELHETTWKLSWADGESFERDEEPVKKTVEENRAALKAAARANPAGTWGTVRAASGVANTEAATLRDQMIADGDLVNRGSGSKFQLWDPDDPALPPDEQLEMP